MSLIDRFKRFFANSYPAQQNITPRGLFRRDTFDGRRDMYKVLGYPDVLYPEDYFRRYERQDVARRLIDAYPEAIWNEPPIIQEEEDVGENTAFETEYALLAKRLSLYNMFMRLDKLSRLGHYAVLFIGLADGLDPSMPAGRVSGQALVSFLMPFSERSACITEYDQDLNSDRYGQPLMYRLQAASSYNTTGRSTEVTGRSFDVHHSRVLHVADGLLHNNVYGVPALKSVYNRLLDLEKVVGGGSEMFWINGRGGLALDAELQVDIGDNEALTEKINDYVHNLSRFIITKGMDIKTLEYSVADPSNHVSVLLDLIASATGIPKRMLIGSERGELASTQDESNWLTRISERRTNYCEGMFVRAFISRMIDVGALPSVVDYEVVWSPLVSEDEQSKADVALKKAQTIATYVNSMGGNMLVPERQFVEEVMGMTYMEEALQEAIDEDRLEVEDGDASRRAEQDADAPESSGS